MADHSAITQLLAQACAVNPHQITGFQIEKKSLDARSRQAWFHLTVNVFIDEPNQN